MDKGVRLFVRLFVCLLYHTAVVVKVIVTLQNENFSHKGTSDAAGRRLALII